MTNLRPPFDTEDTPGPSGATGTPATAGLSLQSLEIEEGNRVDRVSHDGTGEVSRDGTGSQGPPQKPAFDFAALRIDQGYQLEGVVREEIIRVPVRKPHKHAFVRVHPGEEYRAKFALLRTGDMDDTLYVVRPAIAAPLVEEGEVREEWIYTYLTRDGALGLWPVPTPGPDGRLNSWHADAHKAAQLAMSNWVRLKSNRARGGYDVLVATADYGEAEWPEKTFEELIGIADPDDPSAERLAKMRDWASNRTWQQLCDSDMRLKGPVLDIEAMKAVKFEVSAGKPDLDQSSMFLRKLWYRWTIRSSRNLTLEPITHFPEVTQFLPDGGRLESVTVTISRTGAPTAAET